MNQKAIMANVKVILFMLAGLVGANVVIAQIRPRLPEQFQKFTGLVGLAAAIFGAMKAKGMMKDVATGAAAFSALNFINQLIPADSPIASFVPQLSGIGVTPQSLGDLVGLGNTRPYIAPDGNLIGMGQYTEYSEPTATATSFAGLGQLENASLI